jgi:hypothetical protein
MLTEVRILGQASWLLESDSVRLAVTRAGAHLAPVHFFCDEAASVQPYHISPWQDRVGGLQEGTPHAVFRGDFFCLPFGHAEPQLGIGAHGRTAGARWSIANAESHDGVHTLQIVMENALGSGVVTRRFFLCDGENVVYDLTTVTELRGKFTFGHHAVARTPKQNEALLVSTSRQIFGMTYPGSFADAAQGERQSLALGAEFTSLKSVPAIDSDSPPVDCTRFPTRLGFGDLLQIAVAADPGKPAWTAAVNTEEGYLWYSLRNPALLPSTIFWIENCSRQKFPWNGENCSLGLEDVCSYFDKGSKASSNPNAFSQRGVETCYEFRPEQEFCIPYAQGVIRVPDRFGYVQHTHFDRASVSFTDENGIIVTAPIQTGFLFGQPLVCRSRR